MGASQAMMDALARYGTTDLDKDNSSYEEIITSGTPTSVQVKSDTGYIAILANTETVIATITKSDKNDGAPMLTIPAGELRLVKFSKIRISSGQCQCVKAGHGRVVVGS